MLGGCLVLALQLAAIAWQSVTTDEAYHLYAGFAALRYGTNAYNLEHPPLVKLLAGAPLALEPEPYAPPAAFGDAIRTGERLFEPPEAAQRRILGARLVLLAFVTLPLIACCMLLGRRWFDSRTGLLVALSVGLSMATLPYLSLAIDDAAVALGFVLVLLAADRFLQRPRVLSAALVGLAWGVALGAKYSAVLAAPTVVAALALAPLEAPGWRGLIRRLGTAVVAAAATGTVVLGIYAVANPSYDPDLGRRVLAAYGQGASGLAEDRLHPGRLACWRWSDSLRAPRSG